MCILSLNYEMIQMNTINIDESGYTGYDLLNVDQPFQAASAICISDEDAREVIDKFFPKLKSAELKYSNLVRREGNWKRLLDLQRELLNNFDCLSYVCDKKFVLLLHYLDYAVEPFYYDKGVDFYKDGSNYALASLVYHIGAPLLGEQIFDDFLRTFQSSMKSKSSKSVGELVRKVRSMKWEELPECFGPLALETPSCIDAIKTKGVSTDAAYIVLSSLINRLEAIVDTDYIINHDRSKNLEQYNDLLTKMIRHKSDVEFYGSKIARTKFPLKLKAVHQVDSKFSPGVQLADILVGGIVDSFKAITGLKVNKYNQEIINIYRDEQIIHLLPSLDFEAEKKFRKDTQGGALIDYFSKNFN